MSTTPAFDVTAIGNALVDVLSYAEHDKLEELGLVAGSMTLVDAPRVEELYGKLGPTTEMSGGSAANTVSGVAAFGGTAAFIGRVADDTFGTIYAHDLRSIGVHFDARPAPATSAPTGRCLVVVTPDAQRTMSTFLGAGEQLDASDVDEGLIAQSQVLYLEGYLWDQPTAMDAFRAAAAAAHRSECMVALTLSDSFCVERHRDAFLDLVEHDIDILFANEPEITALYQVADFDTALQHTRGHCEIAVLTRGERGSLIARGEEIHVIDIAPVEHVVDTTGAGDLYAAGFLYGLTHGHDLAFCGRLGSAAASAVIAQLGPRPATPLAALIPPLLS